MNRLRPWFLLARIYILPLPTEPVRPELHDGLRVHQASRDELAQAARELPDQLDVDDINTALNRGDICVAAFTGGRTVGFAWGSLSNAPHNDGVQVTVSSPYVYGYKSYVLPQYRGNHLSAALIHARDRIFRQNDRHTSVGFVETHNYPSITVNKRMGSMLVGYAGYVRLFRRYFCFRTPGVRAHTFEFTRVVPGRDVDRPG